MWAIMWVLFLERVKLQNSGQYDEIYIMIADAQALTDNAEHPEKVRQNIIQVALDYLACGIDPGEIHDLYPVHGSRAYRAHLLLHESRDRFPRTEKPHGKGGDRSSVISKPAFPSASSATPSARLLISPLSALPHVPVGEDQMPMLEQCKEIVHKFNTVYGETLTDPQIVLPSNKACLRLPWYRRQGKDEQIPGKLHLPLR